MSVDNNSFETAATSPAPAGRPANWTVTEYGTEEEYADFSDSGNPGDEGYPRETFETGWPDLTQEMIFTLDPTVDEFAIFDIGPSQQIFEDYENNWALPQGSFDLDSIEYAEFNSEDFEDFESDWGTIIFAFETADLSSALFGSSTYDAFEAGWKDNENSYIKGASFSPTMAAFNYPATTYNYENFESVVFDQTIESVDTSGDTITITAHGFSDGDIVYFYAYDDESSVPEGLDEDTPYWIASATTDTFEVEAEEGSGSVDLTTVGTGTKMVKANPAIYWTEELTGV